MEYPTREEMLTYIEQHLPDMGQKLRRLKEKESFLKDKNVYGELYSDRQIDICYDGIFRAEYLRCKILALTSKEARSVREIADALKEKPNDILKEVVELRRKNLLNLESIKDKTPLYRAGK
jgi:predicted transcriptional regulator